MAQRRGTKSTPTVRQQKAINGFLELIRGERSGSIAKVLRDAGYSPATAEAWTGIMRSLRPHLQPHLDWLEMHRAQIMMQMDEKIGLADYAELTRALDVVNKNHQLLGGKPTQRFDISEDDRSRIDEMLDD